MKPNDPLLLADVTLHCGMYPAGKVDISQHLAIPALFNDPTRDYIANNFVTGVYCTCLQILYQITFFYKI